MLTIGITGGTGSGKTTALEVLGDMGAFICDCDAVYHSLLESDIEMLSEIGGAFPGTVEAGALLRKRLGALVFNDPEALKRLNALTHRYVLREVRRQLDAECAAGRRIAAVDAIALFESGLDRWCDCTVGVTAPRETRIKRLMTREGISRDYAALRIDAQKTDDYFTGRCGHTLVNDCESAEAFKLRCRRLFESLLRELQHSNGGEKK